MFTNVKPIVAVMLTLAFALLIQPSAALADSNVAVVNLQKIMKESKAANAIRSQVQEKQKSFQAELDKKEKQLQKEDQELAKQRNVLSQEAFKQKYQEFREKAAAAQKEVRVKRASLDQGLAKALKTIQDKVRDIVEDVCKEQDFDLAVSGNQVLYTTDSQNITETVLKRLDSELPNINVQF